MRKAYRQHALNLLREGKWFAGLPEELQILVLDNSMLRTVEAGHVIIAEETVPTGLFALLEGQVAITRQIGDEGAFFFHLGGPGFWFGENVLLGLESALITATARTKARLLVLPSMSFEQIIDTKPSYFRFFVKLLIDRSAILARSLAQSHKLSPEQYLRIRLADISDMIHSESSAQANIELALSQTDLSNMIGTSRQTINALLKKLEAEGLIEFAFRKIRILDSKSLRGERRKSGL